MRGDIFRLRAPRNTVGHEQHGRRYAVVLQSDDIALSTCIVAPTSTSAYPYVFRPEVTVRGVSTRLMLDQIRSVDIERAFAERVGRLPTHEMREIDTLVPAVLGIL